MPFLSHNDTVFVLTGAGISAESGLATFRGSGGLWNGYRVEEVATPEAWEANPELPHLDLALPIEPLPPLRHVPHLPPTSPLARSSVAQSRRPTLCVPRYGP